MCAGGEGCRAVEITHPWKTKICNMMDLMVRFDKAGRGDGYISVKLGKGACVAGMSSLCHWLFIGKHYRVTGVPDLPHCYYWSSHSFCPLHPHPAHKQAPMLPFSVSVFTSPCFFLLHTEHMDSQIQNNTEKKGFLPISGDVMSCSSSSGELTLPQMEHNQHGCWLGD